MDTKTPELRTQREQSTKQERAGEGDTEKERDRETKRSKHLQKNPCKYSAECGSKHLCEEIT